MIITILTAVSGIAAAFVAFKKGQATVLNRQAAAEEIREDRLEKRIIIKADDVIRWFKTWQRTKDKRTAKKYLRYVINKVKEYDELRSKLGVS